MSEGKINQLVEQLSQLSVLDMSKLKTALEDAWGVKAASGSVMMAAAPVAAAAAVEESTDFQVMLDEAPADKKIGIIKVVRELTGLGLKEAKDLVEAAPKSVKDSAPKAQAAEMKKKLEDAGAKASLKGL